MNPNSKIFVAGHKGLVGSAIVRNLISKGYSNIITRTHAALDLTSQVSVLQFFQDEKPEYVFLAAAKVGGIMANNTFRAQFIFENLQIQNNVIHSAYLCGVTKLLFLGSSCVYPKNAPQPMNEEQLLTSELEFTNEPYAIAKIAGLKMCEAYNNQYGTDFISVMPTNLYGLNDNYSLENSHVLPALIRKIHLSKCLSNGDLKAIHQDLLTHNSAGIGQDTSESEILEYLKRYGISQSTDGDVSQVTLSLWGSGSPLREFLWSDDMADACVFLMQNYGFKDLLKTLRSENAGQVRNTHINIGSGNEVSIKDLAMTIQEVVGFKGKIDFDLTKPDGTPRKLLDSSRLASLGWTSKISLKQGIEMVYQNYSK
ncbi:MAG: GDP-L-fucose [Bacteroidetes bacterium]|nr:MAG: GDP-L-fucose [Bacteroidota bacterium]